MASITRESSPPDAIFSMGWGWAPRLAVKRYSTMSAPVRPSVVGVRVISNMVSGMPRLVSVVRMVSANRGAALARALRSFSASFSAFSCAFCRAFSASAIVSLPWSMAASCSTQRSRRAISSASSAVRCFCCRVSRVSSRPESLASRAGSASMRSLSAVAELPMSLSSSSTERMRAAYSPAAG